MRNIEERSPDNILAIPMAANVSKSSSMPPVIHVQWSYMHLIALKTELILDIANNCPHIQCL